MVATRERTSSANKEHLRVLAFLSGGHGWIELGHVENENEDEDKDEELVYCGGLPSVYIRTSV